MQAGQQTPPGQSTLSAQLPVLESGRPIEREMKGGETHNYSLHLAADQYLHLVVEQKGIDVIVALYDLDGKKLMEVDSPNGTAGPEPLYFITKVSGLYRLEVRSEDKTAPAGHYEAKIEELRAATAQDRERLLAYQIFFAADQLAAQQTKEALQKAIEQYLSILPRWRAIGDRVGESETLAKLGLTYFYAHDLDNALNYFQQAAKLFQEIGNRKGEGGMLADIGLAYQNKGDLPKALDYLQQGLAVDQTLGDKAEIANILISLGGTYIKLDDREKALDCQQRALQLFREVNDRQGEAIVFNDIGVVWLNSGELRKALDSLNQALSNYRQLSNRVEEAKTLSNIGEVYIQLGEIQKALDYYNQALALRQTVGDRLGESDSFHNLGATYKILGDDEKALEYYNKALAIRQAIGEKFAAATTLSNIGVIYNSLGDNEKALDCFNQALVINKTAGSRRGQAFDLSVIGQIYQKQGEIDNALYYYDQALSLQRAIKERKAEAETLIDLGTAYKGQGNNEKARDNFNQALTIFRAVGLPNYQAAALVNLAHIDHDEGKLVAATGRMEEALKLVEQIRANVASSNLRASYFATVVKYYQFYIDLLMRQHKLNPTAGYDIKALQLSERSRARGLLELIAEAGIEIRQGVDGALLARERDLQQRLNDKAERLIQLKIGKHTDEQLAAMEKEISALTEEYQQVEAQIRIKSPRYATLTQPQPLDLAEIQSQLLDADTVLLEYSLAAERSYLWVVTEKSITSFELPERKQIETIARQVYQSISQHNSQSHNGEGKDRASSQDDAEFERAAMALSNMILAPAIKQLNGKRLLIVADGALAYLPFAALPLPERGAGYHPLIDENEIVNLPSASTLAALRREIANRAPAAKPLAILADPIFDKSDERVKTSSIKADEKPPEKSSEKSSEKPAQDNSAVAETRLFKYVTKNLAEDGNGHIARLPFTRQEADKIYEIAGAAGMKALDFNASKATILHLDLSAYRYIHFATHGYFDSERPEFSALLLSMVDEKGNQQDGFLRANEIFNLNLPAELVVLSACETGLGKEVKGEGLIGLTRGFMYAGAARVVVSLWSVNDKATAELMTKFYAHMLKENMRPAAALRAAQRELLHSEQYRAPFYWAPFILQGEVR